MQTPPHPLAPASLPPIGAREREPETRSYADVRSRRTFLFFFFPPLRDAEVCVTPVGSRENRRPRGKQPVPREPGSAVLHVRCGLDDHGGEEEEVEMV